MMNIPMIILILIVIIVFLFAPKGEKFSDSGLAISDDYCDKLANVYYAGGITPQVFEQICGKKRRNSINYNTGNYFTKHGVLV